MAKAEEQARLRLDRAGRGTHTVGAHVLLRTLEATQELVYLVAAAKDERRIGARFRKADDLRAQYEIQCEVPVDGSFELPLALRPKQPDFFHSVFDDVYRILSEVGQGYDDHLSALFPDPEVKRRAVGEIARLGPQRDEEWVLGFATTGHAEVALSRENADYIQALLAPPAEMHEASTVIASIESISPRSHTVSLRTPVGHRTLKGKYLPSIEAKLWDCRNVPVVLTGHVLLNRDGNPRTIREIRDVHPVDLSPIRLNQIVAHGRRLLPRDQGLVFNVELDETSGQLFVVHNERFRLHVFAYTRRELEAELASEVVQLWELYVLVDEETLTRGAGLLRRSLLSALREERTNAAD